MNKIFTVLQAAMPATGQFVNNHKKWFLIVLAVLLLFGGGYATGRWAQPPNVVTVEKEHVVVQEKIVTQTQVQVKTVYIHDKQQEKKTHTTITVVIKPDGTKTTTSTEDDDTNTNTHDGTNTEASKNTEQTQTKYVDRVIEKTVTITTPKPQWRVAAGVGLAIPYFIGQGSPGVPGLSGAVINVELDRRIIGPFFMGLQANSQGVLGLNLSGIF